MCGFYPPLATRSSRRRRHVSVRVDTLPTPAEHTTGGKRPHLDGGHARILRLETASTPLPVA